MNIAIIQQSLIVGLMFSAALAVAQENRALKLPPSQLNRNGIKNPV